MLQSGFIPRLNFSTQKEQTEQKTEEQKEEIKIIKEVNPEPPSLLEEKERELAQVKVITSYYKT